MLIVAAKMQKHWVDLSNPQAPPLERLRALESLRVSLRAFEFSLVEDARAQGATWQEIADAFEITRQAAHERFT